MDIPTLQAFCLSLPYAEEEEQGHPNNILAYRIGEKKFAYFKTSEPEKYRFIFRVSSDRFLALTDQPGIKPARYMHRYHWVTVVNTRCIDEGYLKELVEWSYKRALSSLSKKRQAIYTNQEK